MDSPAWAFSGRVTVPVRVSLLPAREARFPALFLMVPASALLALELSASAIARELRYQQSVPAVPPPMTPPTLKTSPVSVSA